MATILDELVTILGIQVEGEENLKSFKRGLDDASKKTEGFASSVTSMARGVTAGLAAAGAAIVGVTGSMFAMANAAAGPLDEIAKLAGRTGESVEAIQEWGFAAEQGGASAAAMNSAIETMRRRLAQAARGAGAAKTALDDYGISAVDAEGNVRKATDVMAELADRFQDMDEGQRLDIARALGIDMKMVSVLAQGNDEIERLRKVARDAGLVFTREDTESAEAYNDAMNLLMRTVRSMRDRIAIDLLPTLMKMIGGMQDWFNANREVIQQNVGAFMERIGGHAQTLADGFRRLTEFGWPFYAVLGAVAAVMRPFWMRMLLVAGILDEMLTWWQDGGETFLGRFSEYLQSWGIPEGFADGMTTVAAALALIAALKPGAFIAIVGGLGKLFLVALGFKTIGGAAVLTGVGTGLAGIAAISGAKIFLVAGAMWALYQAAEAISKVPFDWIDRMLGLDPARLDKVDTSTRAIVDRIGGRIKSSAPQPRARSDQAAAPEEIPQYGRQTAAESISVPLSSMGGERFTPSIGGQVNDSRDQSTNIDVGGITVNPSAGMDERGLAARIRDRLLSIHGQTPVTP